MKHIPHNKFSLSPDKNLEELNDWTLRVITVPFINDFFNYAMTGHNDDNMPGSEGNKYDPFNERYDEPYYAEDKWLNDLTPWSED